MMISAWTEECGCPANVPEVGFYIPATVRPRGSGLIRNSSVSYRAEAASRGWLALFYVHLSQAFDDDIGAPR